MASFLLIREAGALVTPRAPIRARFKPVNTLPEHLIDCVANPVLADLYGGIGSAYCLQKNPGLFTNFGSILEQILNIGFLVSVYFFAKRSQGGIIDWNETQVKDDDEEGDEDGSWLNNANDDEEEEGPIRQRRANQQGRTRRRACPQCGGAGRFSWSSAGEAVCEMCTGTGTIELPPSTVGMRSSRRSLPQPKATTTSEDP